MKLYLTKDQSKGMIGAVSFEVVAKVHLTEEESDLIKYYKLDNEILVQKKMVNIWGQLTDHLIDVRVKHLVNGQTYKCKSLDEVISYSESLVSACTTLRNYLEIANSFGGKEVFEFSIESARQFIEASKMSLSDVDKFDLYLNKKAMNRKTNTYLGKIINIDSASGKCVIKTDFGDEIEKDISDVMVS